MAPGQSWSKTWTFFDGDWHEGNVPIMGARTHATWLGSLVFDGARTFEGVTPDLDLHCARVNALRRRHCILKPLVTVETWIGLARDGIKRFGKDAELYIRPMYWAERGGALRVRARSGIDPLVPLALRGADAAARGLLDHAVALPPADAWNACRSTPRPAASIPNNARALIEAQGARLRQLRRARPARQYRRARHRQRVHRQGRRRLSRRRRTARSSTASPASA